MRYAAQVDCMHGASPVQVGTILHCEKFGIDLGPS